MTALRAWLGTAWRWTRFAVVFELRLYVALARWILRRPDVPPGATPVGYARQVTPVMCLWIFASALEVPLVHVLTPWPAVRIALLVVSVWGLLWMVGVLASLRVYPHLLTEEGLRVRHGKRVDLLVPWPDLAGASVVDRDLPSAVRSLQPLETDAGLDLQVGVSARADVHVRLVAPRTFRTSAGDLTAVAVTFLADEPRDLVRELRERAARRVAP